MKFNVYGEWEIILEIQIGQFFCKVKSFVLLNTYINQSQRGHGRYTIASSWESTIMLDFDVKGRKKKNVKSYTNTPLKPERPVPKKELGACERLSVSWIKTGRDQIMVRVYQ